MKKPGSIIFLVLLLSTYSLFSQQLRFKHITGEEGLSTNFVQTIIQDELGFMWFGTQDGLNKYDGYQITVFKNDPTNPNSLSCSDITSLNQVKPNLILIGTKEGLNFFDPVTEKFSALQKVNRRLNSRINAIFKLDEDNALIGAEGGLFILNFSSRTIKNPFFKEDEEVNVKCIEMFNNEVFIGTAERGLWRLTKRNSLEKIDFVQSDYFPFKIDELKTITHIGSYSGKMYLGTYGYGIFKVDRNFEVEAKISFAKQDETSNYIRDFVIRDSKIFVASHWGILVYNMLNEHVDFYTKQDGPLSLNSNSGYCIFSDKENNLWIGTDHGGVNIAFFRSQKFPLSSENYETRLENVYAFCETDKGSVFIGGLKTLNELDLETGAITSHNKNFPKEHILCITKESTNVFWLGTNGGGLIRYDRSTKKSKNFFTNALGGTIVCLKIDNENLYAGSIGDGLFKINLKSFEITQFTEKDGLENGTINTIFKDSKGKVWLGTSDGGLVKMNGFDKNGKLSIEKVYSNSGKLGEIASNMVLGINEDKGGNIWAATSSGLSKLLGNNTFYNFYSKDGLANTYLYSILKDSTSQFWMSSNTGIIRFNPMRTEKEITFKNYNIKDGLINIEYNMGAALAAETGMMYFGGNKGFNVFRPTTIKDNLHTPQTYLTSYKRAGTAVETDSLITYKKQLTLSWADNFFQFELAAIDYTDPSKNIFRYKLEGYDKDWSAPSNVRYVSYTQLPGGDYTFKVKAANNDGIWNETPHELHITIVPPFWKTKTFYILIVVFGFALIYFYIQIRTRSMKKENKILENKVAERTKELEEKNRDITGSIVYAKRIQEAILPSKDTIYQKLNKVFILYQPKDIVSGDFYWFAEENGNKIFAVVDCTGHGVPGAFMSMIGHNLLHQIVLEKGITEPGDILNHLHKGVQDALRQGHNEINTNDGMDVSIISINDAKKEIKWAGANRPLVILNKSGELSKYDGNKFPIGGAQYDVNRNFLTRNITVTEASMAYMFSDGYPDQFGGDKGKKFMVKRFHDLLAEIHLMSAEEQRNHLKSEFEKWRQNHEQVDDVLIVGIEI